jgi:integrase
MTTRNFRVYGTEAGPPPSPRILPMTRGTDRPERRTDRPKKRKLGPTLRQVYERHVRPGLVAKDRAGSTVRDIERALERWEAYWSTPASGAEPSSPPSEVAPTEQKGERIPNPFPSAPSGSATDRPARVPVQLRVRMIKRRHLEEFQIHLQTCKSQRGKPFAKSTINGELGSIRQILCAAESHALLREGRPRIAKLPAGAATKFYISRDQMNVLWEACDHATWPRLPGLPSGDWWRCALTLLWLYGFRTQELLAFQTGKSKLDWSCIHLQAETPNPAGQAQNALGWLTYVPQKQKWAKPEPLYLPLTVHSRAAVDWLATAARAQCEGQLPPTRPLFPWSKAHKALYGQWEAIQRRAKIQTKAGTPYELKHLRKSAATYLEAHWPGLGEAVVGWADRGNQTSQPSQVMKVHYQVDEIVMVDRLATYPVPECFTTLLSKPSAQMRLFE